ncbi:MAG: MBL fold metallo-hydrolase [Mycoplasmatota bacterium]
MKLTIIKVGYLQTNCYILKKDSNCIVVDPGDNYELILENLKNLNLLAVFITHNHFDHVGALEQLKKKFEVPVITNKKIKIKYFDYEIIETPGHTMDSVSFYFDETIMFTGDFLFKENIGRTDLNGSMEDMQRSIKLIKEYPINTIICPGHGDKTILKHEMKYNPYFI